MKTEAEKQAHRDAIKNCDRDIPGAGLKERRDLIAQRAFEKLRLMAANDEITDAEVLVRMTVISAHRDALKP